MGFARGNATVESSRKVFTGFGTFKVHGVNLSNEKLSELYGREVTNDRQFVQEVDINGLKALRARLNFTLSTEIDGEVRYFTMVQNITNALRVGGTSGKIQIIDEYGRTAWATSEEFQAKKVPTYTGGNHASVTENYRGAYMGEEFLTDFYKAFMVIPSITKFDKDGKPCGTIDNPKDAEARFLHVDDWFKGDFSELNEYLGYWPNNKIKLLCGVRKDDQNRLWQDFFINFPMRPTYNNVAKVMKEVEDAKKNGLYTNTEFEYCDLKEYVETPSVITPSTASMPTPANPWFQQAQK